MQSKSTENGFIIRLDLDESILESLTNFCKKENITTGFFNGIGAVKNAILGFYNLPNKDYEWKTFENTMEIVSLTGNITISEDSPFLHIHTVLSDSEFKTVGGHLKEAHVGATCEIFLTKLETTITRQLDESIGLKLLKFDLD